MSYDVTRNELKWSALVSGAQAESTRAVVLRRTNAATGGTLYSPNNTTRVVARLLGPGMRSGSGTLTLSAQERGALRDGRLSVALVGSDSTSEVAVSSRKP